MIQLEDFRVFTSVYEFCCYRNTHMLQKLEDCACQRSKPLLRCVQCSSMQFLCKSVIQELTERYIVHTCGWCMRQVFGTSPDEYGGYPHHETENRKLTRHCEVTAILVLFGLPRYKIVFYLKEKIFPSQRSSIVRSGSTQALWIVGLQIVNRLHPSSRTDARMDSS
jgi:hypothetical protein